MRILILEDEHNIVNELHLLLRSLPTSIEQIDHLSSVKAAIDWIERGLIPDMIIADILLEDGLSLELFTHLQLDVPVIYCTAYKEYALDTFSSNVIDYIIKPVTAEKLVKSFNKLSRTNIAFIKDSHNYQEINRYERLLIVHYRNQIVPIQTELIRYIYLHNDCVSIQTDRKSYYINQSLDKLEQILDPALFFRANRRYLIHRHSINYVTFISARKLEVHLSPAVNEAVIISKAKSSIFLRWFGVQRINSY